jgi:hypothetical protein
MLRKSLCGFLATGVIVAAAGQAFADNRASTSKKGSLLIYPDVELRWNSSGKLIQDTFITIINDYTAPVQVEWFLCNGDVPLDAVYAGDPPTQIERAHFGWFCVDHVSTLTHDDPEYFSVATGQPLGLQPFSTTDQGSPNGRPDTDGLTTDRVLRGHVLVFAVNADGEEISWNHLSGGAELVNYVNLSAWEYNAYAFQAINPSEGSKLDSYPGQLLLNGVEYDYGFSQLLFDFFSWGSSPFNSGGTAVQVDTDLTLLPLDMDLREETDGPTTTKAKFDIWNQNEDGFSGTVRCITHWDQTLLSLYGSDISANQFGFGTLHTDKGKARIDGIQSQLCDYYSYDGYDEWHGEKSQNSSLVGVANRILAFSGAHNGRTDSAETLVGQGTQAATIKYDIHSTPDQLNTGTITDGQQNIGRIENLGNSNVSTLKDASQRPAGR